MRLPAALAIAVLALQLPVLPPRDPGRPAAPEPTGTGTIRGRVVAGDTGAPVARATVLLLPTAPPLLLSSSSSDVPGGAAAGNAPADTPPRSPLRTKIATTDAQGGFEFTNLPAGRYHLRASPSPYAAQYLPTAYGAKAPGGFGNDDRGESSQGEPIDLADGQTMSGANIVLLRGSVITGRVTDDNGAPLARVQVYTVLFSPGNPRGSRSGMGSSTDDRGQYRLFALQPGDYVVVAEGRNNTFIAPNAPQQHDDDRVGLLTTYFPGTSNEAEAQRVNVGVGAEATGIDLRMSSGRLFHLSGMVVTSQGQTGRAIGQLIPQARGPVFQSFGVAADAQGHFQLQNIPPGDYRLVVRQTPMGMRGQNPSAPPPEMASMPLSVTDDIDNIVVRLSPGVTITGQVMFEGVPPPAPSNPQTPLLRVNAVPGNPMEQMGGAVRPAVVGSDLTFTLQGLMGEYVLRAGTAQARLKAVLLGGAEDITDTPHEFANGEHVTIVLTTRTSTVQGTVTDDKGGPATDAAIVMFSDNKAIWRSNSVHTHRTSVDQNGQFRMTGVLPGSYLILAAPRDRLTMPLDDAAAFENLAKFATPLVVGDNEQRTANLRVVTTIGGGL